MLSIPYGSSSWLLKEAKAAGLFDKLLLNAFRIIYLGTRFSLKIVLGKKRRDNLIVESRLNFNNFLYKFLKHLRLDNSLQVEIYDSNHDYKVYCPHNKEDYVIMTIHEDQIIEQFDAKQGDTIVDIGAHIGRYTIIASKRVGHNL